MLPKIKILVPALVFALVLGVSGSALAADNPVVNINTASVTELAQLPRVGPALSQRIVDDREANGKFESPADLMRVSGIGERTFELMKPWVSVEGETTLDTKVRSRDAQERFESLAEANAQGDD